MGSRHSKSHPPIAVVDDNLSQSNGSFYVSSFKPKGEATSNLLAKSSTELKKVYAALDALQGEERSCLKTIKLVNAAIRVENSLKQRDGGFALKSIWAAGNGYGGGDASRDDLVLPAFKQFEEERETVIALGMRQLIQSTDANSGNAKKRLEKSLLLPYLTDRLANDSMLEIGEHVQFYLAAWEFIQFLSLEEELTTLVKDDERLTELMADWLLLAKSVKDTMAVASITRVDGDQEKLMQLVLGQTKWKVTKSRKRKRTVARPSSTLSLVASKQQSRRSRKKFGKKRTPVTRLLALIEADELATQVKEEKMEETDELAVLEMKEEKEEEEEKMEDALKSPASPPPPPPLPNFSAPGASPAPLEEMSDIDLSDSEVSNSMEPLHKVPKTADTLRESVELCKRVKRKKTSKRNKKDKKSKKRKASGRSSLEALYCKKMQELAFGSFSGGAQHGAPANPNRVINELQSLSAALPSCIFYGSSAYIRVCESDMCRLRLLIIGPEDTPYANGCFEFDIHLPMNYPEAPPKVTILTTGGGTFRFNPNLYACGKVCLSLLGTWPGSPSEQWNAHTSTILQVIISIQSLIFIKEPYYNEPSLQYKSNQVMSESYSKNIRKGTVSHAMRDSLKAPGAFKDVICAHFKLKREAILEQLASKEFTSIDTPDVIETISGL